ncbi:MAG TPA: serine/threonine-protein kinase [Polyangiaceae bacterium]|nr:serine/threonine-protein kinase [Polyangiaceae bacterium]
MTRHPDQRAASQARVGHTLGGKWRIVRLIDVGGMAAVYEAAHRNGRRAAIKLLHKHYASNAEVRKRFLREGYVANKIDHPGAVAILDDDVAEDGSPFLVMELLEGESLATILSNRGGRLPVDEALAIAGQILEVLAVAHANGIVHRDIKPANVLVTHAGHAKVLDFGLARIRDGAVSLIPTAAGVVMGTAGYMAPEQARGQPDQVDLRTDLFALGAVLFRALSGRRIHERGNMVDMTIAAMKDPVVSLATAMPDAGHALVRAVDRALAFDKDARWQSAGEMFEALRAAYGELAVRATSPTSGPAAATAPTAGRAAFTPDEPSGLSSSAGPPSGARSASLVVEIAFGDERESAVAMERARTREVIDALSSITIVVDSDTEGAR